MNKKIKYMLIIVCILLLTGCTVKSNINLDNNGETTEEVYLLNQTENLTSEKYSFEKLMDMMVSPYKQVLDFKAYSYTYEKGKKLSGVKVYKSYKNICDYFNNSALNQYVYKYISCTENDYYYEVKNATEYIPYCSQCAEWPELDNVELRITLPISAEEQNADEVDETTYIWKYDKDTKDKNFYLKINKNSLKESEEKYNKTKKVKKAGKRIIIIAIIVLVIFGIFTIYKLLKKKYNENSFDYE